MISANELRIGNLIDTYYGSVSCVTSIGKSEYNITVKCGSVEGGLWEQNAKPIPLTEEWLLKFGFDNTGSIRIMIDTSAYYLQIIKRTNDCLILSQGNEINSILKPVRHVHSLQNLFFALTGEELTLKQ